jgi:penicillin-insensitive murein endopeptidase
MRLLLPLLLLLPLCAAAEETPRIVGGPGAGCIAGAVELPPEGPGYETIRRGRSWFWGHPAVIAGIQLLARRAQAAGLPTLYMNDISRPRGGPMAGLHASHMLGLDADVWLDLRPKPALTPAQRDAIEVESLVSPDGRSVDPARWTPSHARLLRMATELPGVDRVLVNAAIKRQLCLEAGADRAWLHLIRPWYDHTAHMHIHFRCPPGQTECRDQAPIPPGDGCDASLDWWFTQLDRPPPPPAPPRPPRLPAPCAEIMASGPR